MVNTCSMVEDVFSLTRIQIAELPEQTNRIRFPELQFASASECT